MRFQLPITVAVAVLAQGSLEAQAVTAQLRTQGVAQVVALDGNLNTITDQSQPNQVIPPTLTLSAVAGGAFVGNVDLSAQELAPLTFRFVVSGVAQAGGTSGAVGTGLFPGNFVTFAIDLTSTSGTPAVVLDLQYSATQTGNTSVSYGVQSPAGSNSFSGGNNTNAQTGAILVGANGATVTIGVQGLAGSPLNQGGLPSVIQGILDVTVRTAPAATSCSAMAAQVSCIPGGTHTLNVRTVGLNQVVDANLALGPANGVAFGILGTNQSNLPLGQFLQPVAMGCVALNPQAVVLFPRLDGQGSVSQAIQIPFGVTFTAFTQILTVDANGRFATSSIQQLDCF